MVNKNKITAGLIFGKHAVLLACCNRNEKDITRIIILKKEDRVLFSEELHHKIEISNAIEMAKIMPHNGGFICFAKPIRTVFEEDIYEMSKIIVLDCVQDIGNIGAIIRTAAAFGVQAVIYTNDKMPNIAQNSGVCKASSGGVELVKLCPVVNLTRTLENLKKHGFWIFGADMHGTDITNLAQKYKNDKKALILGNEESGIRQGVLSVCDEIASISINNAIESLNVSVAGGILMYALFG